MSSKGQVTIPASARRRLGLEPGDMVAFAVVDGEVRLRPVRTALEAVYQIVPALSPSRSDREVSTEMWEEHAQHVSREGL